MKKRQVFDGSELNEHPGTNALSQFLVIYLNLLALGEQELPIEFYRKLMIGYYIVCN